MVRNGYKSFEKAVNSQDWAVLTWYFLEISVWDQSEQLWKTGGNTRKCIAGLKKRVEAVDSVW